MPRIEWAWALAWLVWVSAMGALAAEGDFVTLKAGRSTVVFDRRAAAPWSRWSTTPPVRNSSTAVRRRICSRSPGPDPAIPPGKLQRLAGHDAERVEWNVTESGVTAVFHRLGGQDITVTCTASAAVGRATSGGHCA